MTSDWARLPHRQGNGNKAGTRILPLPFASTITIRIMPMPFRHTQLDIGYQYQWLVTASSLLDDCRCYNTSTPAAVETAQHCHTSYTHKSSTTILRHTTFVTHTHHCHTQLNLSQVFHAQLSSMTMTTAKMAQRKTHFAIT